MQTKEMDRRNFIKKSTALSASVSAATILASGALSAKTSANDKVNIALIGCRGMGFGILSKTFDFDDTNCVALCDIDNNVLNKRAKEVTEKQGRAPKKYNDYRKLLEQKDIDAVIIGTPDHWHCLQMVAAVQAGKDVYVEKPMANTIEECNIMVKAANYYDRIVQVGQQQRSNKLFIEAMEIIKSGQIGNLRKINMWANFNYGLGATAVNDSPVPEGVDYDSWLGPAPKRPFNRAHFHGSWRHFWNYGGGMFSDWGVHLIDMGLWAKDRVLGPTTIMTSAFNNSNSNKRRDTFDTQSAIFQEKDYAIHYDMLAGVQEGGSYDGIMYGVSFIGNKATINIHREGYKLIPEYDNKKKEHMMEAREVKEGTEAHKEHVRNFIDCVKSRKTPACPPEVGRAAALHVHASNISARIGEPVLVWDDKQNRFTNCEKANNYITPQYRAPYTLPKIG